MTIKDMAAKAGSDSHSAKFVKVETSNKFGHIVKEFGNFDLICGIASSNDGLLAVSDSLGKKVMIYEKKNGKYEEKLSLELNASNTNNPTGVIFCPDGKLWVARWNGIEVYSPVGKYEKTISTNKENIPDTALGVFSLAITADGSRILAGNIRRNVITVHGPTGEIKWTLNTDLTPCQMAVIQDTHIAISNSYPGKLSVIVMATGQVTLNADIPLVDAICYDIKTDCVFTAMNKEDKDGFGNVITGTGKIKQYSWRTGRMIACIAQGLYCPTAMTVTSDNKLAVGDTKCVKIFEMA